MAGERNLSKLLSDVRPRLAPDEYRFLTFPVDRVPDAVALCRFVESEGITLVCTTTEAARLGIDQGPRFRLITLDVHSDLEAVGFIAAVTTRLSGAGISTNVVAAYHHDHIFVPVDRADDAMRLLEPRAGRRPEAVAPPNDILLRRGTPDDAEAFFDLFDSVAKEGKWLARRESPPVEGMRNFLERLAGGGGAHTFAERGGRLIGWCDVARRTHPGFDHSGTLGMGLRKEERGRGLGRAILSATMTHAVDIGITRIELEVFPWNEPAVRLYDSFGFVLEGRKRSAYRLAGVEEDLLFMAWQSSG